MTRISEHIEHHARRIKEQTLDKLKRSSYARIIATVIIVVMIIMSWSVYEARVVRNQNITNPLKCTTMVFHQELCEQILVQLYTDADPLLRAPVCEHPAEYGVAQLCPAYYDVRTQQLYNQPLRDRGLSVWEPTANVSEEFHFKTLYAIHDVHIACNGIVIDADINTTNSTMLSAKINETGSCVIIAASSQGTLTSLPFNVS